MSTTTQLVHFLLVYDHKAQKLTKSERFDSSEEAVQAYFEMERLHQGDTLVEIVLIGSDSIETIRLTHANYFDGTVELSPYLVGL